MGHEDRGRPPILVHRTRRGGGGRAALTSPPARPNRRGDATAAPTPGPTTGPWRPDKGPVAAARARSARRPREFTAGPLLPARHPPGRAALGSGRDGRGQQEAAELILTPGSGARGRRNPHLWRRLRRQLLLHRGRWRPRLDPSPRQGDARRGGGGRWSDRGGGGGRGGPRRWPLAPSLGARRRSLPTHSHGERRLPRPPLSRTGPAP